MRNVAACIVRCMMQNFNGGKSEKMRFKILGVKILLIGSPYICMYIQTVAGGKVEW